MRRLGVVLAVLTFAAVGCGGSDEEASESAKPSEPSTATAGVPWASCPTARDSYAVAKEQIQSGREGVAGGKEVDASEELIRIGKQTLRNSVELCESEAETSVAEASLCSRTPAEMAAMLREEENRSAYETAGAYEATCGKHVPNP